MYLEDTKQSNIQHFWPSHWLSSFWDLWYCRSLNQNLIFLGAKIFNEALNVKKNGSGFLIQKIIFYERTKANIRGYSVNLKCLTQAHVLNQLFVGGCGASLEEAGTWISRLSGLQPLTHSLLLLCQLLYNMYLFTVWTAHVTMD